MASKQAGKATFMFMKYFFEFHVRLHSSYWENDDNYVTIKLPLLAKYTECSNFLLMV